MIESPALNVSPRDIVCVDNRPIGQRPPTRVWRYNKPVGVLTTHHDEKGRKTVFSQLPSKIGRVISIGRLDLNSQGLLLLTNDGDLARVMELPATALTRQYKVRAFGQTKTTDFDVLKNGLFFEGIQYGPINVTFDRRTGANVWLSVSLTEGKNREVRNALRAVDLQVNRLVRLSYGPFE